MVLLCLQGISRKLALRQVNRKIIARVARRFTIGIPVLGEWAQLAGAACSAVGTVYMLQIAPALHVPQIDCEVHVG
jgi:hypothetical protein